MKKKEDGIEWKNVLMVIYDSPHSRNISEGHYAKYSHPLLKRCGFSDKDWPKLVSAIEYLMHHDLLNSDSLKVKDGEVEGINHRIELTKKGFDVARELETHRNNLMIKQGILALTGIIALLGIGEFAIAAGMTNVNHVFYVVSFAIFILGVWIWKNVK